MLFLRIFESCGTEMYGTHFLLFLGAGTFSGMRQLARIVRNVFYGTASVVEKMQRKLGSV